MTKKMHTKTEIGAPPAWWDVELCENLETYEPTTKMLLEYAVCNGKVVWSGKCRGVLEYENDAKEFENFLKALSDAVSANAIFAKGPIFGRGPSETWLAWPDGVLTVKYGVDKKIDVSLATISGAQYKTLGRILGEYLLPENVRQPVYSLASGVNGVVELAEVGLAGASWETDNYSEEVIEDFRFALDELQRDEPLGRLLLIDGEPGTGKTFFIRGLIDAIFDAIFVLVPSHMVEHLSGPELVPMLIRARSLAGSDMPIILVIEDADKALVPRNNQDGSLTAISALLNVSDGILGHTLNLRILATTNAKIEDIDPALKRAGRLSKQIHIGPLTPEKASEVYYRLTGTKGATFEGPMPLSEIYRFAKSADFEEENEDDMDEDELDDEDEDDEDEDEDELDEDEDDRDEDEDDEDDE